MTGDILVCGELREGKLKKTARELVTAAQRLSGGTGGSIDAVLIGEGAEKEAEAFKRYGLRKIAVQADEIFHKYSSEGYASALAALIKEEEYGYVLLGATAMGRDLGPRCAAKVDGVMFSDCVDVNFEDGACVARRPIYAGKLFIDIAPVGEHPVFITLRPNNLPPAAEAGAGAEVVRHPSGISRDDIRAMAKEIV
ncbi:MAG: hypothetical protein JXB45_05185, partial [Candidatus Krumholzibacteriota bacterium]|nr:hypothetical protein [Candidatus Krumholzibacteriota bacterium]